MAKIDSERISDTVRILQQPASLSPSPAAPQRIACAGE
jgi:hypothetical protein